MQVFHRHELRHVIGIEASGVEDLLTMRVDDLDRLAFRQSYRATPSSGDNVKVCYHLLVPLLPGLSCVNLADEDVIGEGGWVKADNFRAHLAGSGPGLSGGSRSHVPSPEGTPHVRAPWLPQGGFPGFRKRIQRATIVILQVIDTL